jgi:DNA-binding transcriptional ArsR family regulator
MPNHLLTGPRVVHILNYMVQYSSSLDSAFAALADPTRRGILEWLGRRDATITELAEEFGMTLTGVKKHVAVLEGARLLATEKVGRVRTCRLGPRRLDREAAWIDRHMEQMEERFNRLEAFLERTNEEER